MWETAVPVDCPDCKQPAGKKCWNEITNTPKRRPCWKRTKKAEEAA